MKKLFIFFLFMTMTTFSQGKKDIHIGILADVSTKETSELLEKLKNEIKGVVGQEANVVFNSYLESNSNLKTSKDNYNKLLNNETDIILSFGVINNIMLYKEKAYPKPTIIFGSVNKDFMNLPKGMEKSGVDNLSYLIALISYNDDLKVFKSLFDYKKIGILVEDYVIKELPVKELFDSYFSDKKESYKLIPISNTTTSISPLLNDVDAVYFAGGNFLKDEQQALLIEEINNNKLPSFSAFGLRNIENGVLATNQPESNINQFFRRIALNVESIIEGTNASELPLFIDYKNKLTINRSTANQIGFPLRYSMLAKADFIGSINEVKSDNSLSILDILNGVVGKNLSLQAERKNIDLASQDIKIAKSNYLPDFTASVNGIYLDPRVAEISNGSNPEFSTSGNMVLNQLIYSNDASTNIEIQNDLQKAQKESYNSVELDALLNASVSYFNALILKTNAQLQNENLRVTKRNLELAQENFEAGATGKSDVLRFKSQLAQNTQSLIEAGNQLKQSFNTINQLLNNKISNEIDVDDAQLSEGVFKNNRYQDFFQLLDDPMLQSSLIEFLVEEAKRNAPELKNIDYNLTAIERNYKLNDNGRFLPTVALQGQYSLALSQSGKGSTLPVGIPTIPDGTYNIGLNVSLPIFQQNQRNVKRQSAKIQEDQLLLQKDNTDLGIEKNVNDIVLDLVNEIANIEISKISEETAKESLDLTQNAYKNGAVPIIQLIDAQTNYLQSQLARATAIYNYLILSMQLERSIGYFFLMHSETENQKFIQRASQYILNKN